MSMKRWLLGILVAVACTAQPATDETSEASTGHGSTGHDGSTNTSATTSTDDTGETTMGPPLDCSPYFDDEVFEPRDVVIINESAEPVLVAAIEPCRQEYLGIEPAATGVAGMLPSSSSCNLTCQTSFDGRCGCPTVCAPAPTVLLTPGATLVVPWSGGVYVEEAAPEACYEGEGFIDCASATCPALRAASGAYRLTLRWAPASAILDETCSCVPDASGLCTLEEGPGCRPLDPPNVAEVAFEHPSVEAIELLL